MKRIAIVGGGISGLAAAFALEEQRRNGAVLEYALYESSPHLGGVLRTEHIDGCVIEAGADSFLTEKPWAADLCRAVGLGDQLIGSKDAERKTYILLGGRLLALPDGLMFMVPTKILPTMLSPLFSWKTQLHMVRELFYRPRAAQEDESVASLIERHYGAEMVDRLADPLLSGIYGGEAAALSVRAVLPGFAEMERTHGSLGRAMLAAQKMSSAPGRPGSPLFTSLKNGMQQLVEAVVSRLSPSALLTNTPVRAVRSEGGSWAVSARARSERFDAVILAVPTYAAAEMLRSASPGISSEFATGPAAQLATELTLVQYTSSITVGLGYDREALQALPSGFGFLVPRSEGKHMLAATFVHQKFPHRAAPDRALLRCFIGGIRAEAAWPLSDDQIVGVVCSELQQILGLRSEPLFARVYRWKAAMAQYGVGHLERMEHIARLRHQLPGLAFAGNGYRGIGVPDCIRSGREAAAHVVTG